MGSFCQRAFKASLSIDFTANPISQLGILLPTLCAAAQTRPSATNHVSFPCSAWERRPSTSCQLRFCPCSHPLRDSTNPSLNLESSLVPKLSVGTQTQRPMSTQNSSSSPPSVKITYPRSQAQRGNASLTHRVESGLIIQINGIPTLIKIRHHFTIYESLFLTPDYTVNRYPTRTVLGRKVSHPIPRSTIASTRKLFHHFIYDKSLDKIEHLCYDCHPKKV